MKRKLTVICAVVALLAILLGAAGLWYAFTPAYTPLEQAAADLIRAVNNSDEAAVRDCLLPYNLRPEDREQYGYSADPPEDAAMAEALWYELEHILAEQLLYPAAMEDPHMSYSSSVTATVLPDEAPAPALQAVELVGCVPGGQSNDPFSVTELKVILRLTWIDGDGGEQSLCCTANGFGAVKYRGSWYFDM